MRKIILGIFLLGMFCFSNTGIKNIKWGMSEEDLEAKFGKAYINVQGIRTYKNISYSNIKLEKVAFYFENGKLISWTALSECTMPEFKNLTSEHEKKYGKLDQETTSEYIRYSRKDSKSFAGYLLYLKKASDPSKISMSISYFDPEHYKYLD